MKLNSVDHGLFKFNIFKKLLRSPNEKGTKNLKFSNYYLNSKRMNALKLIWFVIGNFFQNWN
jgi:hypothetical protein